MLPRTVRASWWIRKRIFIGESTVARTWNPSLQRWYCCCGRWKSDGENFRNILIRVVGNLINFLQTLDIFNSILCLNYFLYFVSRTEQLLRSIGTVWDKKVHRFLMVCRSWHNVQYTMELNSDMLFTRVTLEPICGILTLGSTKQMESTDLLLCELTKKRSWKTFMTLIYQILLFLPRTGCMFQPNNISRVWQANFQFLRAC